MTDDWLEVPTDLPDDLAEHWEITPEPSTLGAPAWRARAACKDRWTDMLEVETARPICEACPVRADCLAFALDAEPDDTVVFAGTTFDDRSLICPVCQRPKAAASLGCSPAHTLLRVARLIQIEAEGDPDVTVSMRTQPTYRTYQHCPLPRGANHSSANSYKSGCRCAAARAAKTGEERERTGSAARGPYRRREA